jgi:hypothetical protein
MQLNKTFYFLLLIQALWGIFWYSTYYKAELPASISSTQTHSKPSTIQLQQKSETPLLINNPGSINRTKSISREREELGISSVVEKYNFRLHVFAWKRRKSLDRLLNSLVTANYVGFEVPIYFIIEGEGSPLVVDLIHKFVWPYGKKYIILREQRIGLLKSIGLSWKPESDNEMCFFLEDDLEVSTHYFVWTLKVLSKHNPQSDPNLIGISLVGTRLDQLSSTQHYYRSVRYGSRKVIRNEAVLQDEWGRSIWYVLNAFLLIN